MRIGVVGICQAPGIGMALQQLLESHEIFAIESIAALRENSLQQAADVLLGCDLIFSHDLSEQFGPLGINALRNVHGNVRLIPTFPFTGFHPDCIYIFHEGSALRSPMGEYHSAVAAAAFALGADVDAALRQFNGEVYTKLGYFDEFSKAMIFLDQVMTSAGLDLADDWPQWMARAPFMHTVNHPKAFALASIARLLAVQAELIPKTTRGVEPVHDLLSLSAVWPWYPELAERLGKQGSRLFKKLGGPDLVTGLGVFMTLREFVERSFAIYPDHPPEAFSVDSVERVRRVLQETL
jgi:hypothetical protein